VVQFLGARSQEAFLKAFQKLEQFQENSKFSTWLVRIAINQSLMKLRKQRRKSEVSIDQGFQREEAVLSPEIVDQALNPEERYRTSELRKLLIDALQELRPSLRVVFVLRDIEGLSTEQTAEALNLSQAAAKTRLLRARLQLRQRLTKYFRKTGEFAGVGEISQLCGIKARPARYQSRWKHNFACGAHHHHVCDPCSWQSRKSEET
jgi:RNA polymerase sigma-70 factor, ECF subfamily